MLLIKAMILTPLFIHSASNHWSLLSRGVLWARPWEHTVGQPWIRTSGKKWPRTRERAGRSLVLRVTLLVLNWVIKWIISWHLRLKEARDGRTTVGLCRERAEALSLWSAFQAKSALCSFGCWSVFVIISLDWSCGRKIPPFKDSAGKS